MTPDHPRTSQWTECHRFGAVAAGLGLACFAATGVSQQFAAHAPRADMPILAFALAFTAAGILFLVTTSLAIRSIARRSANSRNRLVWMFVVGLILRLVLATSEPILEVDYNRYLWDGGIAATGRNPYAIAPARVSQLPYNDNRLDLSKAASPIFERISYAELKTIYPPVAQAAFAIAHWIEPWSLAAWRSMCIAADITSFFLLVALLRSVDRAPMLAMLYWWNPLVLKEVVNSAHTEAVLIPLVLASLLLMVRSRHLAATGMLGLAIGTKLWPVMLAPIVLRPLVSNPARLVLACLMLTAMLLLFGVPVWIGGIDATSGFVEFAKHWATNSALLPLLERLAAGLLSAPMAESLPPGRLVRLISVLGVIMLAVYVARPPIRDARDIVARVYVVVTALLLLSPAQFPWYVLWALPIATLHPGIGWHVAAAVMPIYYTAFHFQRQGSYAVYETWIVWMIWFPVWIALLADSWQVSTRHKRP